MIKKDHYDGAAWVFKGLFILFIFIGLAIFISAVINAVLRSGSMPFMMFGGGWDWFWNLIGLLFLIWLLSLIFRVPWHRHGHYWRYDEEEIVRRRYASGEIGKKEYLEIMKNLKSTKN